MPRSIFKRLWVALLRPDVITKDRYGVVSVREVLGVARQNDPCFHRSAPMPVYARRRGKH
jgi:hypothetical protein